MQQTVTATTTTYSQEVDGGLRGEFQCMRLWRPEANQCWRETPGTTWAPGLVIGSLSGLRVVCEYSVQTVFSLGGSRFYPAAMLS